MATSPQFAATPNIGSNVVSSSANASYTAPTNTVTIVVAGSNGTKIEEVVFIGTGTTVAGVIGLFLYDGSTYHFYDSVVINAITPTTAVPPFRQVNSYGNLELKSGWTLVAATFVGSQLVNIVATGGDL